MQMGKFKTWLVTRHHHNHCQHDQKFILYLKPKIRHSRERERENRVEWWHGRDKRVSITRKRNKEKVENGLSPAFPKPKMLNACITFPLQPIKVPHFGPFLFSLSQPLREWDKETNPQCESGKPWLPFFWFCFLLQWVWWRRITRCLSSLPPVPVPVLLLLQHAMTLMPFLSNRYLRTPPL